MFLLNTYAYKVFSIQIFQYFSQIASRVCTLVLFISDAILFHIVDFEKFLFKLVVSIFIDVAKCFHANTQLRVGTSLVV